MRTAQDWLDTYGESHQHPSNKLLHWICVPVIVISLIGMLAAIPMPPAVAAISPLLHWGMPFLALAMAYYVVLSPSLALGMVLPVAATLLAVQALDVLPVPLFHSSLGLFVLAWIGQFVGHQIEGKKPSFFQDLQFLLIGPLWILAAVYRRAGWPY